MKNFILKSTFFMFIALVIFFTIDARAEWQITPVDTASTVGKYASLAINPEGYLCISYCDIDRRALKYAEWDGLNWNLEMAYQPKDGKGPGLYTSLAFDTDGNPCISHREYIRDSNLLFTVHNGTNWVTTEADDDNFVGLYSSLAFDKDGNPCISYLRYGSSDGESYLRFARWNGSSWEKQIVDSEAHPNFETNLIFNYNGNPCISYYSRAETSLKFAEWNGDSWVISTVDTDFSGISNSMAIDPNGNPCIAYTHRTNIFSLTSDDCDLKYAAWNAISWDIQTVDTVGHTGHHASLAFSHDGYPCIAYAWSSNAEMHGEGYMKFKYASFNGSTWDLETIESGHYVYCDLSLIFDKKWQPCIAYCDEEIYTSQSDYMHLMFARKIDEEVPITLHSFVASENEGQVILEWITESEMNNLGFILERCEKDNGDWKEIANYKTHEQLRRQGTSFQRTVYSFTDKLVQYKTTYLYRLSDINMNGETENRTIIEITLSANKCPLVIELKSTYPNPFNPATNISYILTEDYKVNLSVIDLLGRTVNNLLSGEYQPAGRYSLYWNGNDNAGHQMPSGTYILVLRAGQFVQSKKMLLLR